MQWILDNWGMLMSVSVAVLGAASVVTKMTVTPIDDGIVGFLQKLLGFLSGLNHADVGGVKAPLTKPKVVPFETDSQVFRKRDR